MSAASDQFPVWEKQLNQIIDDLDGFLQQTGRTDATVNSLDNIKLLFDKNANDAREFIQAIEQEQRLNLQQFDTFHLNISTSINETLSAINDNLNALKVKIADILELKTTLEEVSYSIKNVSLLMRIKTTKMGKSEFDHVVKGLESLAGQIKENTEGINLSALEATENIVQTCDEIDDRLESFNRLYKPNHQQVNDLQEIIQAVTKSTLKQLKAIAARAEQADDAIAAIKGAEDLKTRFTDRLGDVYQALKRATDVLSAKRADAETLTTVTDLLTGQIELIGEWEIELDSIEQRISKNRNHLQQVSTEQVNTAHQLADAFIGIREKINSFESNFNNISSTFTFSEEKTREVMKAIAAINDNVSDVSRQVSQLDIGRTDLEALTYNAVFKAAKVGMQGKVMESITNEITGLSREMQSKVTDKEAVIKSIVSSSKELKQSMSDKLHQQLEVSNEMNLKIREECRGFHAEIEGFTTLPGKTEQMDHAIKASIETGVAEKPIAGMMQKMQMRLADILHEMRRAQD